MKASAIIVAAGSGTRLGFDLPKAFVELSGRSMLSHSLRTIAAVPAIEEAVITVPSGMESRARAEVRAAGLEIPVKLTPGGAERQDSVRIALALTSAEAEMVIVHDAARPFATPAMFVAALATAAQVGGAIAAIPLADTLKRVADHGGGATTGGGADHSGFDDPRNDRDRRSLNDDDRRLSDYRRPDEHGRPDDPRTVGDPRTIADCRALGDSRTLSDGGTPDDHRSVRDHRSGDRDHRVILATVARTSLWQAQTPQAFRRDLLIRAHERAVRDRVTATDDADLVEQLGATVAVIDGSAFNFKITTAADLRLAELAAAELVCARTKI
jgi:2-C-methyl-D-erythritol 4-phosphate cytidylyltransferase